MQTDHLLATLMQLGNALVAGIMVAHVKTMKCFAIISKTLACRIYSIGGLQDPIVREVL